MGSVHIELEGKNFNFKHFQKNRGRYLKMIQVCVHGSTGSGFEPS